MNCNLDNVQSLQCLRLLLKKVPARNHVALGKNYKNYLKLTLFWKIIGCESECLK